MLAVGGLTLPVQLQAGRICDPELGGDVLSDLRGNVGRVSENAPKTGTEEEAIA